MTSYKESGVDVKVAENIVDNMRSIIRSTWNRDVIPDVSGFQAIVEDSWHYLIPATDGVGSKLQVAVMADDFRTIGQDLVAMVVNDIARVGARPQFFVDYIAMHKIDEKKHLELITSIANTCRIHGIPLIGGETAEMPGLYKKGDLDIAGFAVGKVVKTSLCDGKHIRPGAALLGVESSGLHSNGYSLARKVFFDIAGHRLSDYIGDKSMKQILLEPTIIYSTPVLELYEQYPVSVQGMAHITGGGIPGKLPKCFPDGLGAKVEIGTWPVHKIFDYIKSKGNVDDEDMFKTFNMGIGYVLVINDPSHVKEWKDHLEKHGLRSYIIGRVVEGEGVDFV